MSADDGDDYTGIIRAWRAAPDLMPEPEPWRADAACRDVDPDVFFPEKGQAGHGLDGYARARAICARCPVAGDCLDYALSRMGSGHIGDIGMWAGTTPRERRNIRKARRTAS